MIRFIFYKILANVSECYRYFACFWLKTTENGVLADWGLIWAFFKVIPLYNIQYQTRFCVVGWSNGFLIWGFLHQFPLDAFRFENADHRAKSDIQVLFALKCSKNGLFAKRGAERQFCELKQKEMKQNE